MLFRSGHYIRLQLADYLGTSVVVAHIVHAHSALYVVAHDLQRLSMGGKEQQRKGNREEYSFHIQLFFGFQQIDDAVFSSKFDTAALVA